MDFNGVITCDHLVGNPSVKYVLQTCPRCLSTGSYGGISTEETGDISTVSNSHYLEQAVKKILVSEMNSRGYGFNYSLLTPVIDPSTVISIKREIVRCTSFLRNEQQKDIKRGVIYSPEEEIERIENIGVSQDTGEPRRIRVRFNVVTRSRGIVNITQALVR